MDEIIALRKGHLLEDQALIKLAKSAIRYSVRAGATQFQIYKIGGYITLMGTNIYYKVDEDFAQYFIDQGFTVNDQQNLYVISWA